MIPLEDRLRMQKARESGEFTDFAFVCEGQTINVHKIIICGQSTVFQRACTGGFKVPLAAKYTFMPANKVQEASSGIYDMNDHPLDVVNGMVEYLYTGTYAVPDDADLLTHATMFTLGDKYGIGGLQELASKKYRECLDESCNYHDFPSSISQVYNLPRETSKTLRVGALVFARDNMGTALAATELATILDEFLAQKAGQFTDFAFLCKGKKIPVHKIIICAQSKVFNAACISDFKEARSGVYDLSEYPLELVEMMVDYFYVGHYDNPIRVASKLSLSIHSSMLALADKYDIQGLIRQAIDLYIHRLKHKHVELEDFLNSLPVLHELPISVSRDAIDAAVAHTRETVLTCICRKATKRLIDQISDASQDFLKEVMMSIMSTPLESRCGDCNQRTRSLKISQEIRYSSPYPTSRQYNTYQNGLAGL
ncbi:hypothetical protein FOVSG1_011394 [Fusarium oxysporum f. sp. vasinfectum]